MLQNFLTDMSVTKAQCSETIKTLTISHEKLAMLIANPDENKKQSHRRSFMLKYKFKLIPKFECCCSLIASLDKAWRQFGIKSWYYADGKKVWPCAQPCLIKYDKNTFRLLWFIGTSECLRYVFELCDQEMIVTTKVLP